MDGDFDLGDSFEQGSILMRRDDSAESCRLLCWLQRDYQRMEDEMVIDSLQNTSLSGIKQDLLFFFFFFYLSFVRESSTCFLVLFVSRYESDLCDQG